MKKISTTKSQRTALKHEKIRWNKIIPADISVNFRTLEKFSKQKAKLKNRLPVNASNREKPENEQIQFLLNATLLN